MLCVLSLAMAASEGAGFMLLVPLAAYLAGSAALPGQLAWLAEWLTGLGFTLALFVALVALRAALDYAYRIRSLDLTVRIVDGLRLRAVEGLLNAEWSALSKMHQAENRALLITTIDRVSYAVTLLTGLLRLSLLCAALLLAALAIAPAVAAIMIAVAGLLALLYGVVRRRARHWGAETGRHYTALHASLEEMLGALRIVKSYGRERRSRDETAAVFGRLRDAERRYLEHTALARAAFQIAMAAALAALVFAASEYRLLAMSALLPLVAVAARSASQFGALLEHWQQWNHAAPALDQARAVIAEAEANAEPRMSAPAPIRLAQRLTFCGVHYGHRGGTPVLAGIDCSIGHGEIVALSGPSGAGKSTFADLAAGLLAPDAGTILIDGKLLGSEERQAWRRRVAYVQQEPVLFSGTVRGNLLWGSADAEESELVAALDRANATFVFDLPNGLDCDLGEASRHLSGGERQRIALARALLRTPDLLILDEATSALDDDSEIAIASAIGALRGDCAVLVISHRGRLSAAADRKFELAGGRLRQSTGHRHSLPPEPALTQQFSANSPLLP